jgi:hypothetical protein
MIFLLITISPLTHSVTIGKIIPCVVLLQKKIIDAGGIALWILRGK